MIAPGAEPQPAFEHGFEREALLDELIEAYGGGPTIANNVDRAIGIPSKFVCFHQGHRARGKPNLSIRRVLNVADVLFERTVAVEVPGIAAGRAEPKAVPENGPKEGIAAARIGSDPNDTLAVNRNGCHGD